MLQRNKFVIPIMAVCIVLCSFRIYAASYVAGTYPNGLSITGDSELTGGNYAITGDFTLGTNVKLTIMGTTSISVSGNIYIRGPIVNRSTTSGTIKMTSQNGNIQCDGSITIVGAVGAPVGSSNQLEDGAPGQSGGNTGLEIVAENGNITINQPLSNTGGTGGIGGTGGGSSGNYNGGNGGQGGNGGIGGSVSILAKAGKVELSSTLKSLGGTGGKGGTGGPDQSVLGFAGDGGTGGTGGAGGTITIVGQTVKLNTTVAVYLSGGAGGAGGDGGSGGTFSGGGNTGTSGTAGGSGFIDLEGGAVYYGANIQPYTVLPGVPIFPADAPKKFMYDSANPNSPTLTCAYFLKNGEYFTNTQNPTVKIGVPADNGFLYRYSGVDTVYKSGISYFIINDPSGFTKTVTYNPTQVTGGYQPTMLDLQGLTGTRFSFAVTAYDKYGKNAVSTPLVLNIDKVLPPSPTLRTPTVDAMNNITLSWNAVTDTSDIMTYSIYADSVLKATVPGTNTSYTTSVAGYNTAIKFSVLARDGVGNQSPLSNELIAISAAKSTTIQSIALQGSVESGIKANVSFVSVGLYAGGYQIMYYPVDYKGDKIGQEVIRQVGTISTPESQTYTLTVLNLEPNQKYLFFIRTYNKNYAAPLYGNWQAYLSGAVDTSTVANNSGVTVTLSTDETWEGTKTLAGDVIVPAGITLTIRPSTTVKIPAGRTITVNGKIVCDGTKGLITFTSVNPLNVSRTNIWKGILLTSTSRSSLFNNVIIENSERGLILNGQTLTFTTVNFKNNYIGLHAADSTFTMNSCRFENNIYYGVKEETGCVPQLNNNTFAGNGLASYYKSAGLYLKAADINSLYGTGNLQQ